MTPAELLELLWLPKMQMLAAEAPPPVGACTSVVPAASEASWADTSAHASTEAMRTADGLGDGEGVGEADDVLDVPPHPVATKPAAASASAIRPHPPDLMSSR